jgi:hypothetical protein
LLQHDYRYPCSSCKDTDQFIQKSIKRGLKDFFTKIANENRLMLVAVI